MENFEDHVVSEYFKRFTDRSVPKIAHPTANAFDASALIDLGVVLTARDQELIGASVFLNGQFQSLRKTLLDDLMNGISRTDGIKLSVGLANYVFQEVKRAQIAQARAFQKQNQNATVGVLAALPIGANPHQPFMNADDLNTTIVECLPNWLFYASKPQPIDRNQKSHSIEEVVAIGSQAISIEHSLKSIWLKLLWEGWKLRSEDGKWVVGPPDPNTWKLWHVWQRRQEMLWHQETLSRNAAVRLAKLPDRRQLQMTVAKLEKQGESLRLRLGEPSKLQAAHHNAHMEGLESSYMATFLDLPLDKVDSLITPRLLAKSILVIGDAARLLNDKVDASNFAAQNLHLFSLAFSRNSLKGALKGALRVGDATSDRLLDRLTSDPSDISSVFNRSCWHRPLVRLDDSTLLVVGGVVFAGSPVRMVELWIKEADKSLATARRGIGRGFEQHVRDRLVIAASQNRIAPNIFVAPHGIPRATPSDEEVDLIIRLGETAIVGEIKCFVLPCESKERFDFLVKLRDATAQATRKAQWLRQNAEMQQKLFSNAKISRILPMVILNTGIGLGLVFGECPVTDLHFLELYLGHGQYHSAGLIDRRSGEATTRTETLYTSAAEAESKIQATFRSPPVLRQLLDASGWGRSSFPLSNGSLIDLDVVTFDASKLSPRPLGALERAGFNR